MISLLPFVLLAQTGPTYPFPTLISVSAKAAFVGTQVRTFSDQTQDLELVQTDALYAVVKAVDAPTGRMTWEQSVRPVSERLDGQTRNFPPDARAMSITEVRAKNGAQFRFDTALDEMDTLMLLSRFNTVPLPKAAIGITETWEFSDGRSPSYLFRGRVLGFENGLYKVRTYFEGQETPKFTANGLAWIGANGLPSRIELTAKPIEIPGGEGQKTTCALVFTMSPR